MPFEIDHQEEVKRILSDPLYAKEVDEEFELTKYELECMRLLSTHEQYQLTIEQQNMLADFIYKAIGNLDLNTRLRKLRQLSQDDLENSGLTKDSIDKISYFTYKTRNINELSGIIDKVDENQRRMDQELELDEDHRITLREYSIFTDGAKLKSMFDGFQTKIKDADHHRLSGVYKKISKADELNKRMEQTFNQTFQSTHNLFTAENIKRKALAAGEELSFFERLVIRIVTKHKHTAKLYSNKDEEITLSHINPNPKEDKFTLRDFMFSDVYQVKIENLISDRNKVILQEIYGDDWLDIIKEKYSRIEKAIHDNTAMNFSELLAQSEQIQRKAGIASLLPFGLGHKKLRATDFSEIREKMLSDHYKNNQGAMLCSEFVAQTTIAAMVELNNQLNLDARAKDTEFAQSPIKIPISKHENLRKMQPDRFIKILRKKGCLEKVKKSEEIKKYFKK